MNSFDDMKRDLIRSAFLASLARCISYTMAEDVPSILLELEDYGPLSGSVLRWGPSDQEYVVSIWFEGCVAIFWRGLGTIPDFLQAYLKSDQIPSVRVPGMVNRLAAQRAMEANEIILDDLEANAQETGFPSSDLFLVGHSQGGANSLAFYALLSETDRARFGRENLVTIQSPRALSPSAAQNLVTPHLRISVAGDLVSHVPPNLWTANYPPFSLPPKAPIYYMHHGKGLAFKPDGSTESISSDFPGLDLGFYQISRGFLVALANVGAHEPSTVAGLADKGPDLVSALIPNGFLSGFSFPFLEVGSMAIYKLTYFFQQDKYGWSETFYIEAVNLDAAKTVATANSVVNARAALLAQNSALGIVNPSIEAVRISNIAVKRDAALYYLNVLGTYTTAGYADFPNTAILVSIKGKAPGDTAERYRRSLYLRGQPDTLVINGGQFNPIGTWVANFNAWGSAIRAAGFGMMAKNVAPVPIVNSGMVNVGSDLEITTLVDHGFSVGDLVQIAGVLPKDIINGEFQVIPTSSTKYKILGVNIVGTPTWYGTSAKRTVSFIPFSSQLINRVGHRDTGRPFDTPVGRQRT